MSTPSSLNPYASPNLTGDELIAESPPQNAPASLGWIALRWTLVCSISAAPSFVFGYSTTDGQILAMLLGILCFILLYVWLDYVTRLREWRQNKTIRRVLTFCYGTRVVISIVFPVGGTIDLFAGIISVSLVHEVLQLSPVDRPRDFSFFSTFVTTLVQGFVLNLVILTFAVACFGAVGLYRFVRDRLQSVEANAVGTPNLP